MLPILFSVISAQFNIQDFGAVPHSDTLASQFANSKAINAALLAANNSLQNDRTVIIPHKKYFSMPILLQGLKSVTLRLEGKVIASKNVTRWPKDPGQGKYQDFVRIIDCDRITITGGGKLDGRGYHWWILVLLAKTKYLPDNNDRPHLIQAWRSSNLVVRDVRMKNSAQYHFKLDECTNVTIQAVDIRVNATAQFNLLKHFSLEGIFPMYAFNTDGIDPHGSNMIIRNLTVLNYDDVVVPKPGHRGDKFGDCTENMLVEDIRVKLGVGMSVGSVPPSLNHACIRNITFKNVFFDHPFKAIYVKTNPGNQGDGEVTDILYANMTLVKPIWWAIYIGPQQMKEPDGDGPGCLLFPFDPKGTCETQPRITIRNITLQNITTHDPWLYPVTIRCNETNPCTGFRFNNVTTDKWKYGQKQTGVLCQNVKGSQIHTKPSIYCFQNASQAQSSGLQLERGQLSQFHREAWQMLEQAVAHVNYQDDDQDDMTLLEQFDISWL